jgi:hypothetical protein
MLADFCGRRTLTDSRDVGHARRGCSHASVFHRDNEVTDPVGFEEYRKQVPATL